MIIDINKSQMKHISNSNNIGDNDTTNSIDIKENKLRELSEKILPILLKDRTTKKNILWCTDTYEHRGKHYLSENQITPELITGYYGNVIKPRIEKSKREQLERSRKKAEVFTPSWICNKQNNLVDNAWFNRENVFNYEIDERWVTNNNRIEFHEKDWKAYILDNRLEISCGEAPYLTSRYDTVTGEFIAVKDRIGLLDRKLRIVHENTNNEKDYYFWAINALKSIYGYDWQGDNVLIARENLLMAFIEYYEFAINKKLETYQILEVAEIISWNIWQMDGLKFVIPNSCKDEIEETSQLSLFDDTIVKSKPCTGCAKSLIKKHNGIYCKIMDWERKKQIKFVKLLEG